MSQIKRLEESVVNRIAAGEVIQRPANAVKELIENSLDAGSTSISVVVKEGGLLLLQITDNGHGINKEDLQIVCERFTTSKLTDFTDLKSISTFGFRGEALSSISHVATLQIITKTKEQPCAYKAKYLDGKIQGKVSLIAGNLGTQITITDLFYNVPTRKNSFKSASEELQKIATVITRYAVHNTGVSFHLKKINKAGKQIVIVHSQESWTKTDAIGALFGSNISKELIHIKENCQHLKLDIDAYVTNANVSLKKFTFLLFINGRLVECTSLKKSLDLLYQTFLPRGASPFIYMSLKMHPNHLDVNVHPTKHQVHFLNEEDIVEEIQKIIENKLLTCDSSRNFFVQKIYPQGSAGSLLSKEKVEIKCDDNNKTFKNKQKVYDHKLVRTDSRLQTLDQLVSPKNVKVSNKQEKLSLCSLTACGFPKNRNIKLTSIVKLQTEVMEKTSKNLTELLKEHSFVGSVDVQKCLLQYKTDLYIVDAYALQFNMFYQIIIDDFGNFPPLRLSEPASIKELTKLALDAEEAGWTPQDGSKDDLADYIVKFLSEKSEMLKDYFSIEIENEQLKTLPMLLNDYQPLMFGLPMFILRISTEVCWEDEDDFFKSFSQELARFYTIREECVACETSVKSVLENIIFPNIRKHLKPPESLLEDGCFVKLADLHQLYKVFERC